MNAVKFFVSVRAAARGIAFTFARERNFRIEVYCAIGVLLYLLFLQAAGWHYAIVGMMIMMVLGAELMNTALERVVDILKPHKHPYARVIKDISAGMVLVVSIGAAVVGVIVLLPLLTHI